MLAEISSQIKLAILALSRKVTSYRKISAELAEIGRSVRKFSLARLLEEVKDKGNGLI